MKPKGWDDEPADELLSTIEKDTAFRRFADQIDVEDDSLSDTLGNKSHRKSPAQPLSREEKLALAGDYILNELESAKAKYRLALIANPNDLDAKWNYEKMIYPGGLGKKPPKEGNKSRRGKKPGPRVKAPPVKGPPKPGRIDRVSKKPGPDKKGKGKDPANLRGVHRKQDSQSGAPELTNLRLPPQQAEQLLNSIGQHEQQAAKAVPTPVPPPPQGKDWWYAKINSVSKPH